MEDPGATTSWHDQTEIAAALVSASEPTAQYSTSRSRRRPRGEDISETIPYYDPSSDIPEQSSDHTQEGDYCKDWEEAPVTKNPVQGHDDEYSPPDSLSSSQSSSPSLTHVSSQYSPLPECQTRGLDSILSDPPAAAATSRNRRSADNKKRNRMSPLPENAAFGAGSTQLIPTTLGNSPPPAMAHLPVVVNHRSKAPTTPIIHGVHGSTSPTSYAVLPGTTSSTRYAATSPRPSRTSRTSYTSPIVHVPEPKPRSLLTPSGRTFALGGRVRNVSDELNPILMFWPDNEPLPLACQIRPPEAVPMAFGGVHGPPPILNTGNKGPIDAQPGDWVCGKCDYLNWRRRRVCANCFPHAEGNTEGTKHSTAEVQERVALLASVLLHQQQQVQVQQQQIQAQQQAAAALLASNASGLNGIQMNSMNTPGTSHATALTSQRDALNGYGQTVPATRSSTAHTMNLPPRLGGSMDQTLPRFSNASTTSLPSMTSTSSSIPSANSYTHAHSNRQNLHNLRIATDSKVAPASGRPSPASARFNISAGPSSSLSLPGDHMWPSSLPLLPSFLQEVISASDVESQSQSFSSLRGSHSSQYKGDEYSPPNSVSSSQHSSPALEAVSLPTVPLSERHQAILDSVRPPTIFDMGIVTAESNTPVAPTARRPSNLFAVAGPPYLCDSCGKNFAIMHDLKRHQTTHIAGVKTTHLCPYCGKSFSRRDAVQRHVIAKKCTVAANNTHLGWPPPADHLPPAQ